MKHTWIYGLLVLLLLLSLCSCAAGKNPQPATEQSLGSADALQAAADQLEQAAEQLRIAAGQLDAPVAAPQTEQADAPDSGSKPYNAQDIFANYCQSVVHIETSSGGGTGFFVEENVIATNNHVIADAGWATIKLQDGSIHDVISVLASSWDPDLALLEVDCTSVPLQRNTHGISEGEPVYAIGAPMGIYPCISDGIVMKSSHSEGNTNFFLSNVHSIGGNSGGPVLNGWGELMGVVVGGMSDGPNSIDLIIQADHLDELVRSDPVLLDSHSAYIEEMNRPEEEKFELAALSDAMPGQLVTLGRYEQDGDLSNGPEDLYWLVQERNGDELVLMSLYCLDVVPYHNEPGDITWEQSSVRAFLNSDFFDSAFDAAEQQRILTTTVVNAPNLIHETDGGSDTQDRVYLPSLEEIMRYFEIPVTEETFFDQLYGCATPYVIEKGVWLEIPGSNRCWWWLRSPGGNPGNACEVGSAGYLSFNGTETVCTERAVRPMIRVKAS